MSSPDALAGRSSLRAALGLALAIATFYLALAPWTTLWDRDEPRFARAAVEMLASGNYLYPTFNGELRPHKPILVYWLMSLSVRWMGPTELAVRLWSPLGIAFAALFTFMIGCRLRSARTGLAAMLVLALNPLVALEALAATTDALLLASITGSLAAFVSIRFDGPRTRTLLGLVASLTLAQLLKGPVGLVLPLVVMSGFVFGVRRSAKPTPSLLPSTFFCALASLLLFGAWAVPANLATGGRLLSEGLIQQVLQRIWTPLEGHGGSFVTYFAFYPLVVLVGFHPWVQFLPAALRTMSRGHRWSSDARALLWAWFLGPLILFTLAVTKLPHYLLPAWPALAIVVAGFVVEGEPSQSPPWEYRWLKAGWWIATMVALIGLAALPFGMAAIGSWSLLGPVLALVFVAAVTIVVSARALRRRQHLTNASSLAAGTGAALLIVALWAAPIIDGLKPVPRLIAALNQRASAGLPVVTCEAAEPSLVFYLARPLVTEISRPALADWARQPGAAVLITTRDVLDGAGPLMASKTDLVEVASAAGLNVAKGQWIELVALCRACGA